MEQQQSLAWDGGINYRQSLYWIQTYSIKDIQFVYNKNIVRKAFNMLKYWTFIHFLIPFIPGEACTDKHH